MFTARDRLKLILGGAGSAALLSACGGGGSSPAPVVITPPPPTPPITPTPTTFVPTTGQFRAAFTGNFLIGAAVQANQVQTDTDDAAILRDQFNSITAEYEMKPDIIAPTEGAYDWSRPDALIDFAEANNIALRGHALCWHTTAPAWMLSGTPEQVKTKLQKYVTDVVTRYRGRIYAWDVVNEVVTDDSSLGDPYRRSNWWDASGGNKDYIDWAFEAARAADPDCKLYINDYGTEFAGKRGRLLDVVRDLQARDIPVDGIGHQLHINVGSTAAQVLQTLDDVENTFTGLDQHVTELDISIYSDPASCFSDQTGCAADYGSNIPDSALRAQAQLYRDIFEGFKTRTSLKSVTIWGVSDAQSWLDSYPVDRTNAPLLWDRDRDAKSALQAILDPAFTP